MKKAKILFAPLGLYFSHISRCLSIAKELESRFDIEFISCERYANFITEEGFKVHRTASENQMKQSIFGAEDSFQERFNNLLAEENYNYLEMILSDFRIISDIKPDMIVFDGRITAHLVAEYMNIPSIEIRNHVGILSKHELEMINDSTIEREVEFNLNDIKNSYQEIMDAIKLLPQIHFLNFLKSYTFPPIIVPGFEEFELSEKVNFFSGRKHLFVGPLVWNGWKKWDKKITYKKDKKTILVTLGSTFPIEKTIQTIIDALAGDDYYLIINTGDNFNFKSSNNTFQGFEVHQYLNIEETVKNVDLVIHHGGHGTAMLSLKAGKPSIVIPFNGDHLEISRTISKLELGLRIKKYPEDITENEILEAVNQIFDNDIFKKNAQKMANYIKNKKDPEVKAAEFIEKQIILMTN